MITLAAATHAYQVGSSKSQADAIVCRALPGQSLAEAKALYLDLLCDGAIPMPKGLVAFVACDGSPLL